jgi:hypothetical protein
MTDQVEDGRLSEEFRAGWVGCRVRTLSGPSSRREGVIRDVRRAGSGLVEGLVEYPSRLPDAATFSTWLPLRRLKVIGLEGDAA